MAVLFNVQSRRNPKDRSEKYYAVHQNSGLVPLYTGAEEVAKRAGQSEGAVIGLLRDIFNEAVFWMKEGYSVRLGNLGILHPAYSCRGASSVDEFKVDNIKKVKIHLRPSVLLKQNFDPQAGLGDAGVQLKRLEDESESE